MVLLAGEGALPAAKEYVDARGISPFHEWFIDLHAPEAAKVTGAIISDGAG
jgi:hypothetical protein